MFVNRPPPAPVNLVLQHWCKALQSLYCTIRRLFVLFVAYSRTIRTIRRLFADYSYYSSTIRGLFVLFVDYSRTIRTIRRLFALFVDYSHYSLHYSSFINCLSTCPDRSTKCFSVLYTLPEKNSISLCRKSHVYVKNKKVELTHAVLSCIRWT